VEFNFVIRIGKRHIFTELRFKTPAEQRSVVAIVIVVHGTFAFEEFSTF
jgi:hypothetical protein